MSRHILHIVSIRVSHQQETNTIVGKKKKLNAILFHSHINEILIYTTVIKTAKSSVVLSC